MYFKDMSRFRQAWLGVAMIWILWYHCSLSFGPIDYFRSIGYGGVDICIFASGFGCFYSLVSESNPLNFMKRRLKRLGPTYLIFLLVWLVYQYLLGNFGFRMAVGNLLGIQYFTGLGNELNWYIGAILLMYLLAPYFKEIVARSSPVRKGLFFMILIACTVPFWKASMFMHTIARLPIFYLGMVLADLCKKDKKLTVGYIVALVTAFILGNLALRVCLVRAPEYLGSHALYWYPFILIVPPLCIGVSCLSSLLEKTKVTKPIVSFLSLCGSYSFEVYLIHIALWPYITKFIREHDLTNYRHLIWLAGCVLLFIGCFLLRRGAMLISKLFERPNKKCSVSYEHTS